MKFENDFEVPADPTETFELLVDLERVGSCIPGGEVGPASSDGSHPAKIAVKLGPMRMNYTGKVRIDERNDEARRAVLATEVREQRGQGSAKATMSMTVAPGGAGSLVTTVTDVNLAGRAAQMGRGVVDDVAARLVADMAECIAGRLTPPETPGSDGDGSGGAGSAIGGEGAEVKAAAKPVGGLSLMARVLWTRLKRLFRGRTNGRHDQGGENDA